MEAFIGQAPVELSNTERATLGNGRQIEPFLPPRPAMACGMERGTRQTVLTKRIPLNLDRYSSIAYPEDAI